MIKDQKRNFRRQLFLSSALISCISCLSLSPSRLPPFHCCRCTDFQVMDRGIRNSLTCHIHIHTHKTQTHSHSHRHATLTLSLTRKCAPPVRSHERGLRRRRRCLRLHSVLPSSSSSSSSPRRRRRLQPAFDFVLYMRRCLNCRAAADSLE